MDKTKSSRTEVLPTITNAVRPAKIDINRKKSGDRTVVSPMYATDLLDNRKSDIS
ncbi:MAG: hypothetical protein WBY22_11105 [Nitrososphaeraceae archaeon]